MYRHFAFQPDRLRQLVEESGLSQYAFGKAMDVSQGAITKWICGKSVPTADCLLRICTALSIEPWDLMKATETHMPTKQKGNRCRF